MISEKDNDHAPKLGRRISRSRWCSLWNATVRHGVCTNWSPLNPRCKLGRYISLIFRSDAIVCISFQGKLYLVLCKFRCISQTVGLHTLQGPLYVFFVTEEAELLFFYYEGALCIDRKDVKVLTVELTSPGAVFATDLKLSDTHFISQTTSFTETTSVRKHR